MSHQIGQMPPDAGLQLTSWTFIALAVTSIVVLRSLDAPHSRSAAALFFATSFYALLGFSLLELVCLFVFVNFVFVAARAARHPKKALLPRISFAVVVIGLWVLMFVGKDPVFAGLANPFTTLNLKVIGLSYLCFRAIATIMDAPELERFDYLTFIDYMTFFPTVLAGPIERYDRFEADRIAPKPIDIDLALATGRRIALGFVKKCVLADNLTPLGIYAFGADAEQYPIALVWLGVVLQVAIVFLDFSGYCDIMIGIARFQGHEIQENFNRPYLAPNLQEWWNHWHISLTLFVRDYVFTPISKWIAWNLPKRLHTRMMMIGYFLTMMIIALWHQITWGFVLFGLMHGAGLVALQLKRRHLDPKLAAGSWAAALSSPPLPLAIILPYLFFSISTTLWFFSPAVSWRIFMRMFGLA